MLYTEEQINLSLANKINTFVKHGYRIKEGSHSCVDDTFKVKLVRRIHDPAHINYEVYATLTIVLMKVKSLLISSLFSGKEISGVADISAVKTLKSETYYNAYDDVYSDARWESDEVFYKHYFH